MKMELVLKYRGKTWHYPDILLKDFYIPVVSNTELDFEIEPAIWFKSLIIKSVLIDCEVRNVFWESLEEHSSQRTVFEDNRLEESELFISAMNLTQICDRKGCAREILRILHLHVIPAIVLKRVDIPCLSHALETVEDAISSINKATVQKDRDIFKTECGLKELRDKLLFSENFESKKYLKHCNETFLNGYLDDINRDIRTLTDKLLTFPSSIEMNSSEHMNKGEKDLNKITWRKKKEETQSTILRMQCIQGAIKTFMTKKKKKSKRNKSVHHEDHESYVVLKMKLENDKATMQSLFEAKVKVTSVREATFQAIKDLKASGESTGLYITSFGEPLPTDILGYKEAKPKKWLTLNERVQRILNEKSNDIAKNFQQFHVATTRKIEGFLSEQAMIERKKEENVPFFMPVSEYTLPPRKAQEKPKCNGYANISGDQDLNNPCKRFTQLIKGEVMQHTYDQCQLLIKTLSKQKTDDKKAHCSKVSLNNTWVFYELQLYRHLIQPLCNLYEYIHKGKTKDLLVYLTGKTLEDLGVEEPWLTCRKSSASSESSNKYFQESIAIVTRKSGEARALTDLYESDDELNEFFDTSADSDYFSSCEAINNFEYAIQTNDVKDEKNKTAKSKFKEKFTNVNNELKNLIRSKSVMGKLKSIAKANSMVSDSASSLKAEQCGYGDEVALNAEDMLASISCVLTFLEGSTFEKLYAHVHLVNDFIPPFMMGSMQDWSLTNFFCAFQNFVRNMESLSQENETDIKVNPD